LTALFLDDRRLVQPFIGQFWKTQSVCWTV